ncbi:MAG: hypothetical protein H0V44_07355 [Planctomycetes bacterium]|nr:hypothetical protein [Planctomycetota bacterium]
MIESLAKTSMVLLIAASAPIESAESALWCQWGLAGMVVAYVLWRDHHRERRMASAIDAQQRWIRDTMVTALDRNGKVMERMVAWLEDHDADHR